MNKRWQFNWQLISERLCLSYSLKRQHDDKTWKVCCRPELAAWLIKCSKSCVNWNVFTPIVFSVSKRAAETSFSQLYIQRRLRFCHRTAILISNIPHLIFSVPSLSHLISPKVWSERREDVDRIGWSRLKFLPVNDWISKFNWLVLHSKAYLEMSYLMAIDKQL